MAKVAQQTGGAVGVGLLLHGLALVVIVVPAPVLAHAAQGFKQGPSGFSVRLQGPSSISAWALLMSFGPPCNEFRSVLRPAYTADEAGRPSGVEHPEVHVDR